MQLDTYRSLGFWTLALCYYARHDPTALLDPDGDQLASDFVVPLVQQLRHDGLLKDYSWMRYSEGGFHLRCQFRAQSDSQARQQYACISARFECFKHEQPALFEGDQRLSPMAEDLNQRAGVNQLHPPGTLHAGPVHETGEELVYDHAAGYLHVVHTQTLWSDLALQALGVTTGYDERLWIGVAAGAALLHQHASCATELAAHALFIAATWRQHFRIVGTATDPQAAAIWGQRARVEAIAAATNAQAGHAATLVPASLSELTKSALARGAGGVEALAPERPALRAMQVLALVHQMFNRLGISLIHETAVCDLIHQQALGNTHLEPEPVRAKVDEWIHYWSQSHVASA